MRQAQDRPRRPQNFRYANIYDQNWLMKGNVMIAPGVERVDTVKTADGYEMKKIWSRNDLSDTSSLKRSTATGYLELLRLQDRFVYLPEMPYREVDLDQAARNVVSQEQFELDGGEGEVASWRNSVTARNVHPNTTASARVMAISVPSAGVLVMPPQSEPSVLRTSMSKIFLAAK